MKMVHTNVVPLIVGLVSNEEDLSDGWRQSKWNLQTFSSSAVLRTFFVLNLLLSERMAVLSTVQSEDTLWRGKGRGNPDLNGCHDLTAAAEGLDGITLGCICKYRKLKGTLETFIANRVLAAPTFSESPLIKGGHFKVYFKLYVFQGYNSLRDTTITSTV